jgi:hypothetical protein
MIGEKRMKQRHAIGIHHPNPATGGHGHEPCGKHNEETFHAEMIC